MTYSEKLKDPRWQKMRLKVLERDGWQCQECGDKETMLCVHHRYYESGKDPWEYPPEALRTLCEHCHKVETVDLKKWQDRLLLELAKHGYNSDDLLEIAAAFACQSFGYPPGLVAQALSIVFSRDDLAYQVVDLFINDLRAHGHTEHADQLAAQRIIPKPRNPKSPAVECD
jgi:hypothetical protein